MKNDLGLQRSSTATFRSFEERLFRSSSRSLRRAFFFSLSFHSILICLFSFGLVLTPKKDSTPRHILVQAVKLSPKSQKQEAKVIASLPPGPKETPPALPSEPYQAPPSEPKQEKALKEEPPAPVDEKETEIPEPVTEKETLAKKPLPKQKSTTQRKKVVAQQKQAPKKTAASKKKTNTKSNNANKEVARGVQSLLAQAKQKMQQGASSSKHQSGGGGGSACSQIATLTSESTDFQEGGTDGFDATPEELYISTLIRLMQISITIPDKEPVSLKLTLLSSGLIKSLKILSSPSSRNSSSVEKGLNSLRYPSFGKAYHGESEHTFSLRLNREMEWLSFSK